MSLLCFIQGHAASTEEVWNRGYSFSKCRRCQCDMIRSDGEWETVPRGHRVVWKQGRHSHSRPAGFARNLPVLYRDVRGGVPERWHGGWRNFVRMLAGPSQEQRPGGGAQALTLDDPEREPRQYSYAIAVVAVVGASLQLLFASRPRRDF